MTKHAPEVVWAVDRVHEGAVMLTAHRNSAGEGAAAATLFLRLDGDVHDPKDNHRWRYTLTWPEPDEERLWRADGRLLAHGASWRIASLELEAAVPAGSDLAPAVTSRVLRRVPLGLIHEALETLTVAQIVAADSLLEVATGLSEFPEGYVPYFRPDDPAEDPHRGTELRYATRILVSLPAISRLTRRPPLNATAELVRDWPAPSPSKAGRPPRTDRELLEFAWVFLQAEGVYRTVCIERDIPLDTARGWVKACRAAGWLAPGEPGRRGSARPGPRLVEMIQAVLP